MRLSFLLLLMATAAFCAPKESQLLQSNECSSLGEITQAEHDNRFPGRRVEITKANVTSGKVTCSNSTKLIFLDTRPNITLTTKAMTCNDGLWFGADRSGNPIRLDPTEVACERPMPQVPPTDKPNKCAPPEEFTQAEYLGFQLEKITKANVTNDKVTCSDSSTYLIFFEKGNLNILKSKEMMCDDGVWFSELGPYNASTSKVACARKKCDLLPEITQAVYDSWPKENSSVPPGYEVTMADFTVGGKFSYEEVTCSNKTQWLVINTNDGFLSRTDVIECDDDGQWIAKDQSRTEIVRPTQVACAGRKRQVPPTDKPKKV